MNIIYTQAFVLKKKKKNSRDCETMLYLCALQLTVNYTESEQHTGVARAIYCFARMRY